MLTDHNVPAPLPQQWSVKKITLWLAGILLIFTIAILAYDEKLEPYDDLMPRRTSVPDSTTNGYLFLRERWGKFPEISLDDRTKAKKMQAGLVAWDESLFEKLKLGRETLRADLSAALAMPEWLTPPTHTSAQITAENLRVWLIQTADFVGLEAYAAAQQAAFQNACVILADLHKLSARQVAGSSSLMDFMIGRSLQQSAASLCCDLLSFGKLDGIQVQSMSALWNVEPVAGPALEEAMRGETAVLRTYLSMPRSERYTAFSDGEGAKLDFFLLKTNQTQNRYHRRMREWLKGLLQPASTLEDAKGVKFPARSKDGINKISYYFNSNFSGDELVESVFDGLDYLKHSMTGVFFTPRAMQVRLALYRWQAAHSGELPRTLEMLVPEYLESIPSDPWNGKPLMWDLASESIYAVGSDWKPKVPFFSPAQRAWFAEGYERPGLRLHLAAPPP